MAKIINTSGKRKTAIARATLKPGNGRVRINSVPLEIYGTNLMRMKIAEPRFLRRPEPAMFQLSTTAMS